MHDGLVGLCCHCDCWLCAVDLERRIEDGEEEDEETPGGEGARRNGGEIVYAIAVDCSVFFTPKKPKAEAGLISDAKLVPWHTSTLTGGATVLTSPIHMHSYYFPSPRPCPCLPQIINPVAYPCCLPYACTNNLTIRVCLVLH